MLSIEAWRMMEAPPAELCSAVRMIQNLGNKHAIDEDLYQRGKGRFS
jgi:hypothetical protein